VFCMESTSFQLTRRRDARICEFYLKLFTFDDLLPIFLGGGVCYDLTFTVFRYVEKSNSLVEQLLVFLVH
jgi:hypothetical protein